MKILLDEDLDHRLRQPLGAHEVFTVQYLGWAGLRNGELLLAAEQHGIEVFVTGDQELRYQQNIRSRRLAIIVLSATNWPIIKHHLPTISAAIAAAAPGSFQEVACGTLHPQNHTFQVISFASVISSIAYRGPSRPVPEFFTPP